MIREFQAKPVIVGEAVGESLVSKIPLSFWGGVNVETGVVVDVHHDLCGKSVTGKILFIPGGRGSCSGSGIILEMIRQRTAPLAIVSIEAEPILAIGSIIGKELYDRIVPLYNLRKDEYDTIVSGEKVELMPDGTIRIFSLSEDYEEHRRKETQL